MKFIPPKSGWKTYAVVLIGIGLGVADHFGWHIPTWVDWTLTFLGMGTLRMAVKAQSVKAANDLAELFDTIMENITVPDPNIDVTGATIRTVPVEQHQLPPVT